MTNHLPLSTMFRATSPCSVTRPAFWYGWLLARKKPSRITSAASTSATSTAWCGFTLPTRALRPSTCYRVLRSEWKPSEASLDSPEHAAAPREEGDVLGLLDR